MHESVRNLKMSAIELRRSLPVAECDWLVGRLRAHPAVAGAVAEDTRRLLVEYDADRVVSADLVEWLSACGVRVVAVRPRPHAAEGARR